MKDAYDLGYDILNLWRSHSIAQQNSGSASKSKVEIPCYVVTANGIDPVRGIYYDKDFGLMIDAKV